jgi:hypothetical protein
MMKCSKVIRFPIFCLFLLLVASACNPKNTISTLPSHTPAHTESSSPVIISTLPIPSKVTPQKSTQKTETPTPVNTISTIEYPFILTPYAPIEGAEYRPPLYQVPWAPLPHYHFYFSAPIAAKYPGDPIWDYRYGGILFGPDIIHSGIDLPAPRNAEVLAAGDGTVIWVGYGLYSGELGNLSDPYGLAIAVRHDFGYKGQMLFTVYAHLEDVKVIVGQHISTGNEIGLVGSSGMTTGPHLHFEVRMGENDFWKTLNPELWIAPPQEYGVLVGRVMSTGGTRLDSYTIYLKDLSSEKQYSVKTYGPLTVNIDEFFNENVVLGDLPAGIYEINIPYGALNRKETIQILPGQITFFTFNGFKGFDFSLP